ncbi:MAG: hypothetical protein IBX62_08065 [Coriobacteriia bacterium]|nr:hypothetical protein [Coriobacteriia bacterium]
MFGAAASPLDTFIQYAGTFLQMGYFAAWLFVAFAAVWAARSFARYVSFVTGAAPGGSKGGVRVEEFVE